MPTLGPARVRALLGKASQTRLIVVGDVMLDQFVWGRVSRISPEAPVPVLEFERESFMPGGAANVARNLTSLEAASVTLFGVIGGDEAGRRLRELLQEQGINQRGLLVDRDRVTSIKTRIIAHKQQVVRVDRETHADLDKQTSARLLAVLDAELAKVDAVIVGDYGKGVVTQWLLDALKERCRQRGIWLSLDPKPVRRLNLTGLSLITPNRREAFELAGEPDTVRSENPLADTNLKRIANKLQRELQPALLLVTLGDQGMLLCCPRQAPFHIPTVAQEVYDVSGAGDTVIASFTLAVAAGASPVEAAVFSNHAAGVVVGKVGTAAVKPEELLASFKRSS